MIKRFIYIVLIILLLPMSSAMSQDYGLPDLSNYQHNWMIYNPAFAGSREVLSVSTFARAKRVQDPGGPFYTQVSVHTPMKNEKVALGVSIYTKNDPMHFGNMFNSPMNEQSLSFDYAYRIDVKGAKLALGLSGAVSLYNQNFAGLSILNADDDLINQNLGVEPETFFNAGFGALYYTENYFIGLSVPRFFSKDEVNATTFDYKYFRPILTGGYEFYFSDNFTLNPTFYTEYSIKNNVLAYAASMNVALLDKKLWLGMIYKAEKRLSFNTNIEVSPKVLVGFSYDYSLDSSLNYFHGSYEFVLRYEFRKVVTSNIPFYY